MARLKRRGRRCPSVPFLSVRGTSEGGVKEGEGIVTGKNLGSVHRRTMKNSEIHKPSSSGGSVPRLQNRRKKTTEDYKFYRRYSLDRACRTGLVIFSCGGFWNQPMAWGYSGELSGTPGQTGQQNQTTKNKKPAAPRSKEKATRHKPRPGPGAKSAHTGLGVRYPAPPGQVYDGGGGTPHTQDAPETAAARRVGRRRGQTGEPPAPRGKGGAAQTGELTGTRTQQEAAHPGRGPPQRPGRVAGNRGRVQEGGGMASGGLLGASLLVLCAADIGAGAGDSSSLIGRSEERKDTFGHLEVAD